MADIPIWIHTLWNDGRPLLRCGRCITTIELGRPQGDAMGRIREAFADEHRFCKLPGRAGLHRAKQRQRHRGPEPSSRIVAASRISIVTTITMVGLRARAAPKAGDRTAGPSKHTVIAYSILDAHEGRLLPFGERLHRARERLEMTQAQLAASCAIRWLDAQYVERIEQGLINAAPWLQRTLARESGMPLPQGHYGQASAGATAQPAAAAEVHHA